MAKLTRRTVFLTLTSALAVFLGHSDGGPASPDVDNGIEAENLLKIFDGHEPSAQAVGREYLRKVPAEADSSILISLVRDPQNEIAASASDPQAIRLWARSKARDDFANGRVVTVKGWTLSETEARLCALSAVMANRDQT